MRATRSCRCTLQTPLHHRPHGSAGSRLPNRLRARSRALPRRPAARRSSDGAREGPGWSRSQAERAGSRARGGFDARGGFGFNYPIRGPPQLPEQGRDLERTRNLLEISWSGCCIGGWQGRGSRVWATFPRDTRSRQWGGGGLTEEGRTAWLRGKPTPPSWSGTLCRLLGTTLDTGHYC